MSEFNGLAKGPNPFRSWFAYLWFDLEIERKRCVIYAEFCTRSTFDECSDDLASNPMNHFGEARLW